MRTEAASQVGLAGSSDFRVACDAKGLARAEGGRALLLTLLLWLLLLLACAWVSASPAILPVAPLLALKRQNSIEARRGRRRW